MKNVVDVNGETYLTFYCPVCTKTKQL